MLGANATRKEKSSGDLINESGILSAKEVFDGEFFFLLQRMNLNL